MAMRAERTGRRGPGRIRSGLVALVVLTVSGVGLTVQSRVSAAATCPGALLQNWSFEQRSASPLPDHWDPAVPDDVGGGATYATDGAWYSAIYNGNVLHQTVPGASPGATYELQIDAGTHDPNVGNEVLLRFLDISGGEIDSVSGGVTHDVSSDSTLATITLTGMAPAGTESVDVVVADHDTVAPYAWTKVDAACLTMTAAAASYSLGNELWIDANDNVRRDPGEDPVPDGVVLRLLDAAGTPVPGQVTTTTGGLYLFSGLAAGDYRVELPADELAVDGRLAGFRSAVGQEAGDVLDADASGPPGVTDNGAGTSGAIRTGVIALGPGDVEPTGESPSNDLTTPDPRANLTVDLALVPRTDLTLVATVDGTAVPGSAATASFTAGNRGPATAATGWSMVVRLPTNSSFGPGGATGTGFTCAPPSGRTVTCTAAFPLGTGAAATLDVDVAVDPGATGDALRIVGWVLPAPGDRDEWVPLVVPGPTTVPAQSPTNNDAAATLTSDLRFALGGRVWLDGDGVAGDGLLAPGEPGIARVGLALRGVPDAPALDADGTPVAETDSGPGGRFLFTGLAAGSYRVCVLSAGRDVTAGVGLGGGSCGPTIAVDNAHPDVRATTPQDDAGTAQRIVDTADIPVEAHPDLAVTVTPGENIAYRGTTATFDVVVTNTGPGTATPGALVRLAVPTPSAASLHPVALQLDGGACGTSTSCTVPAGISPGASVTLRAALTVLAEVPLAAPTAPGARLAAWVTPGPGGLTEVVPAAPSAPTSATDTAATPTNNDDAAGATVAARFAIGDQVWLDQDRDGARGSEEPAIDGVLATLERCAGGDAMTINGQTVTPLVVANGRYVFDRLPAGCYRVAFSDLPPGHVVTRPHVSGVDGGADSAVDPETGRTADIELAIGRDNVRTPAAVAPFSAAFVSAAADLVDDGADLGLIAARADLVTRIDLVEATPTRVDWRITVTNNGPDADPGPIVVTSDLPAGLGATTASGTGWNGATTVGDTGSTLRCTRSTPLSAGAATTIDVTSVRSAPAPLMLVAVAGGAGQDTGSTDDNTAGAMVSAATGGTPTLSSPPLVPFTPAGAGGSNSVDEQVDGNGITRLSLTGQDTWHLVTLAFAVILAGLVLLLVSPWASVSRRPLLARMGTPLRRGRR